MKQGLILAMAGGLLFALAGSLLPWQTFQLAGVSAISLELGAYGALMLALALAATGLALWGLASGRRKPSSRLVIIAGLGLFAGLVYGRAHAAMGLELMPLEAIAVGPGWLVGLVASLLVIFGGLLTRSTLAAWDETSPLLRVLVLEDGVILADRLIYEPSTVRVRELVGARARGKGELPSVTVSPEGDATLAVPEHTRLRLYKDGAETPRSGGMVAVAPGDRVVASCDGIEVACAFVAPLGGRVAAPLLARSEVWAFGAAVLVAHAALAAAPVLAWTEEAHRELVCEPGLCPGVVPKVEPDPATVEVIVPADPEATLERTAKAAGGPEGKLGDPTVHEVREVRIPRIDGPRVARVDPHRLGLNALLTRELATSSSVAEVLRGERAATTDRIAAAMDGDGSVLVLGPGTGIGFQGDGEGGPGDDLGRILAVGDLDDGPPGPGIRASLGDPPKRKVGVIESGPHSQSGFCRTANIESVVRRRAGSIRACYEKSLQVRDTLAGKVTVRWTIGQAGAVESASAIGDTLGDAGTTRCILDWVRRMRFEAPDGGFCVVQWPFVFSAGR